ncbi:MAG: hypothetical protein AVDCRST_MAG93-2395 [uncultured Chloroflexia bacterium]|uniref:Uncharacterized protein n=1 Tax=uncultured Chloroflexia bacterium TaxID=1672391 RepID=A0A6J4J011_9CHLR|nr:MAG: hypothetical protein AVDCRST_MAG93-2395 [uncultured Chloroflexia bacterium]
MHFPCTRASASRAGPLEGQSWQGDRDPPRTPRATAPSRGLRMIARAPKRYR